MKKINNLQQLQSLIQTNNLQDLFSAPLLPMAELFYFDKDEYITRQHVKTDYIYFIVKGHAKVFAYLDNDQTHCQQYFRSCEIIGETDLLWDEPPISYVLSLSECLCIGICLSKYRKKLLDDTTFLRYTSKVLASRLKDKTTTRNRLISLETRLINHILAFQENGMFCMNLKESAELLDSSYRHLLRIMAFLCEKGTLKRLSRGKYEIVDMQALIDLQ